METDINKIDVTRKFVRIIERRPDGLVEFEFAIGEPELFAELLLPEQAYEAFCKTNDVEHLDPRPPQQDGESSDWEWDLHQATHQRFR